MPARLFRRIQSLFSRLNKTLLLSIAVFLLAVFFVGLPVVKAASAGDYNGYLNLFDGTGSGISHSNSGDLANPTTKVISGFKVNVTLAFSSNDSNFISSKWDHVKNDIGFLDSTGAKNDSFLIRVCNQSNVNNCWLNTIPYDANINSFNLISQKDKDGNYRQTIPITDFPILYSTTVNAGLNNVNVQNGVQYIYTRNTSGGKNEGTTSDFPSGGVTIAPSSNYELTFWYCADSITGIADGSQAYQTIGGNSDTIATFGNSLCSGHSYFRIGNPITISVPADATAITAQTNNQQASTSGNGNANTPNTGLPECGIGHYTSLASGDGTINGCMADIAYGIYSLTSWIAGLFGNLFDYFIGYSLSDMSYRYEFAVTGWKLVRDISNVFFIIIMVWTGFSAVFDTEKTSMKKVVPALIVNALLINFSLFVTRLVIDISNITARVFYTEMLVCKQTELDANGNCPSSTEKDFAGYPQLSAKILGSFNPQRVMEPNVLQAPSYTNGSTTTAINKTDPIAYANYLGIVSIVAAIIMAVVGIMFFRVAFLFLGRVIGLYICMIFSPFAFLSRDIPLLGGVGRLRWGAWLSELTNYALLAPIFVFFLYIIFILLSSNFAQQMGVTVLSSSGFFEIVLSIVIPMVIIFSLLTAAQKAAESFAGEAGKAIQAIGNGVAGLAVGVGAGTTALLGARVIGGAAKKLDESRFGIGLRNSIAKGGIRGWTARKLQQGINVTRTASFDVRQTVPGNQLFKAMKIDTNQKVLNTLAPAGLGLGVDQRKGGIEADIKRRTEDHERYVKLMDEKAGETIKKYNENHKTAYDKKVAEAIDNGILMRHTRTELDTAKNATDKTEYTRMKEEALGERSVQDTIAAIPAPKSIRSTDELNSTRRKEYMENLTKEGYVSQGLKKMAEKGGNLEKISKALGFAVDIGTVFGIPAGDQVRAEADKIAAKKIEEKTKADKELQKIEETLKKGFRDLIATERFQGSPRFLALSDLEKENLRDIGIIQSGPNKGKGMYDILTDDEKRAVDTEQTAINADRESREKLQKRVQIVELNRYDIKDLRKDANELKKTMVQNPTPVNISKYFSMLDEIEIAVKHGKIWNDIGKYQEEQKKKAKGE